MWMSSPAPDKCVACIPRLVWLGFEVCAERMTLHILDEKLRAVLEECDRWLSRPTMMRKALQSLLGHLAHITNGIPAARQFISRLLAGLRGLCMPGPAEIDPENPKDIRWFRAYAKRGNGIHLLPPPIRREWVIECLTGGGAFSEERCYAEEYSPDFIQAYPHIHGLEALHLVFAMRTLCPDVSSSLNIIVNTDNADSTHTLEMGRATDATLAGRGTRPSPPSPHEA